MLELFLLSEYSTLILIDFARGIFSWGIPASWIGSWCLIYLEEFLLWWFFPIITMLWWRSWAKKHPELLEEL